MPSDKLEFTSDSGTSYLCQRKQLENGSFLVTVKNTQKENSPLIVVHHNSAYPNEDPEVRKKHDLEVAKAIDNAVEMRDLKKGDTLLYMVDGVQHKLKITKVDYYSKDGQEISRPPEVGRGLEARRRGGGMGR